MTRPRAPVTAAAVLFLVASLFLALSWRFAQLHALLPVWLTEIIYPISKTDLDPLRLLHFFALAYVVLRLVPAGAPWLKGWLVAPVLDCGRQSLHVFCLGVLLSFAAQTVLTHVSGSLSAQFLVTVLGIGAMVLLAKVLSWYRSAAHARRPQVAAGRNMGA